MENTNQTQISDAQKDQPVTTAVTPAVQNKPKKKAKTVLFYGLLALMVGVTGYLGVTNPQLFKAEITETEDSTPSIPGTFLTIPNYNASPVDNGKISVRTTGAISQETLVSMQFKIKYSPVGTLTFSNDSLIFDDTTLFKSAELKSINTSTPGEASISFFSNTGVVLTPADTNKPLVKLAVKINGVAQSSISLSVTDVEVIKKNAVAPLYSVSTQFTSISSGKINLVSQAKLRVLYAQALDATHVLVKFNDLIKSVGPATEYTFDNGLTASSAETGYGNSLFAGYDQSTVILTTSAQAAGAVYTLTLGSNNFILGNINGNPETNYNKAFFSGYQVADGVTNSSVQLTSANSTSSTQVVLNFSGAVLASSITPINIEIFPVNGQALQVISAVTNGSAVTLTTAKQVPDSIYFIRLNNVKDMSQSPTYLPIVNNREMSFFGFISPSVSISKLTPSVVTNEADQTVVVVGENLDSISEVDVNNTKLTISNQTAGAMNITVPKGFPVGIYDVIFIDAAGGVKTLDKSLAINNPSTPMKIVSEQSKAIPYKVAPDGTTKVKLWVLVEDPVDLANIDSVTMDLEQIGGARAQEMTKDTGLQQKNQQFYIYTATVSKTTPTSATPYQLPVEVRKGAVVAKGTVAILVTNNVLTSIAPTVDQAYISPAMMAPDAKGKGKVSAKVTDQDGVSTIRSVVADLGPVGAGFVTLSSGDAAAATGQLQTGFYQSADFTVPVNVKEGVYQITITATDETGASGTANVSLTISAAATGPTIDQEKSYISPRKSVPKDGKTSFSLNAMISDPDGMADIDSVTAYFPTMGLKPATLLRDPSATDTAKTALYESQDIIVPSTASFGVHDIQIVATDKSGGKGNLILQLDVTFKDTVGEAPYIVSDKSYTAPKVAINDGQTAITLYTFVRDDDTDLDSVVVNLTNIGQVGPEELKDLGSAGTSASSVSSTDSGACSTNSTSIVCMQASFKEGSEGQWYVLPNVTIATETSPSNVPYKAEVIATDKMGNVSRGQIPVYVQNVAGYADVKVAPQVLAAVPTAPGKLEVLFNKEMSASSVTPSGFTINEKNDVSKAIGVIGATVNSDGNLVTLTTDSQSEGKGYVLSVGSSLKDQSGASLVQGKNSKADFNGFVGTTKQPSVYIVSATDPETVYVEFAEAIRPSSVKTGSGLNNYDVKIFEADDQTSILPISDVEFDNGNALAITTLPQKSGQKYIVQISNVASAGGVPLKSPIAKVFKAVKVSALRQAAVANQADLNGDGKIDFTDFTMFSAVYGKAFSGSAEDTSAPTPATPNPDSTIPHTSVPAGGEIK